MTFQAEMTQARTMKRSKGRGDRSELKVFNALKVFGAEVTRSLIG